MPPKPPPPPPPPAAMPPHAWGGQKKKPRDAPLADVVDEAQPTGDLQAEYVEVKVEVKMNDFSNKENEPIDLTSPPPWLAFQPPSADDAGVHPPARPLS